jgi:hypothetical protein
VEPFLSVAAPFPNSLVLMKPQVPVMSLLMAALVLVAMLLKVLRIVL